MILIYLFKNIIIDASQKALETYSVGIGTITLYVSYMLDINPHVYGVVEYVVDMTLRAAVVPIVTTAVSYFMLKYLQKKFDNKNNGSTKHDS
jgi:hypothetical protein